MADGTGRPPVLGTEIEHYWLVQRMAKATKVDLVKAFDAGLIFSEDWVGLVTRCRGCQWTEGCDRFLNRTDPSAQPAPAPCRNRERLAEIRAQLEELNA